MKKLASLILLLSFCFLFFQPSSAIAAPTTIHIVSPPHQNLSGVFINDDLAELILPTGVLGSLVFSPPQGVRTWLIDAELIDEIIAMSTSYTLVTKAAPLGKDAAISFLETLKQNTFGANVIALAYGNPDVNLARRLAPSELLGYFTYGKSQLEKFLGRPVKSQPYGSWSSGRTKLDRKVNQSYTKNRIALTRLAAVVSSPEIYALRNHLSILLSPKLTYEQRSYFSDSADIATVDMLNKLRIVPGKYQVTSERVKLPVTLINNFDTAAVVNLQLIPLNSRIQVMDIIEITLAPKSRTQLEVPINVIAAGSTKVTAQFSNLHGQPIAEKVYLLLNMNIIDPRITWFTSAAAILLFLAAGAQSIRRIRRSRK